MPSNLIPRPNGRCGARVMRGGREVWLGTFDSEELAREAVNTARSRGTGRVTVADWFAGWPLLAAARRPRSEETIARTVVLSRPFVARFGDDRLGGVSRQAAVLWAMQHPGASRYARTILADAVWMGAITSNPLQGVSPPQTVGVSVVLSEDDVSRVAQACENRMMVLVLLAACSGLRLSECLALEARDLEGDTLHVRCGKGGREGWSILFEPGLTAFHALAPDIGRLFPLLWTRRFVSGRFRVACNEAGVEGATFHSLRHFHASWLIGRGASRADVALQLRHLGLRTVDRYIHLENASGPALERLRRIA